MTHINLLTSILAQVSVSLWIEVGLWICCNIRVLLNVSLIWYPLGYPSHDCSLRNGAVSWVTSSHTVSVLYMLYQETEQSLSKVWIPWERSSGAYALSIGFSCSHHASQFDLSVLLAYTNSTVLYISTDADPGCPLIPTKKYSKTLLQPPSRHSVSMSVGR